MRRIYFAILIVGILIAFAAPAKAQVSISLGFGISSQPVWGPTGYDEAQYYYLPDIDAYYSVYRHRFFYQARGRWISSAHLPPRYHDYDLYGSYKVVINEDRPYMHDQEYREKYSSYRNRHDQQPIRDSHDSRYFVNKNHPEHNNWARQQGHGNGRGREQGRDERRNPNDRQGHDNRQEHNNRQAPDNRQDNNRNQDKHDRQDEHGDKKR